MTSLFRTLPQPDAAPKAVPAVFDPWHRAIGVGAVVLLSVGVILIAIGLGVTADTFTVAVILAGAGLALALGVGVGTCWLVLGSLAWRPAIDSDR